MRLLGELVVLAAAPRVDEKLVGFLDLLELLGLFGALGIVAYLVGVALQHQPLVRLPDGCGGRVARHAQRCVRIHHQR